MLHNVYFMAAVSIAIVFFTLAVHAARRWAVPGAKVVIVIMLAAASYAMAFMFQMTSPNLAQAVFWYNVSLPGANLLAPAWFVFVLMWIGRARLLSWRRLLLLGLVPALVCLAAWTNPLHQLYGTNFHYVPQRPWAVLEWDFGLWYWVGFIYAYGLSAVSIIILLDAAAKRLSLFFYQTVLLLAGISVPVICNLLFNAGITPVAKLDLTPFTFIFMGIAWSLAFFRFRVLNIIPVAQEHVFSNMPMGMIVLDTTGRVVDINPSAREMLGMRHQSLEKIELPPELSKILPVRESSSEAGPRSETICLGPENEQRCLDVSQTPFFDQDNKLTGVLLLLNDVTARKLAEDALRESENKLRSLFASMSDVIIIYGIDGGYLEIAPTNPGLYILPPQELLGRKVNELFPPEQARVFMEAIYTALEVGKFTGLEYCLQIGQRDLWFSANISALSGDRVIWVARDVTEKKLNDQAIQESEARLAQAQAIAHLGNWEIDLSNRLVRASAEAARIYGFDTREPVEMDRIQELALPEEREHLDKALSALLQDQGVYDQEYRIRRANDGRLRVVHAIANVVKDAQGQPARIFGVIQDITERKMAEKELQESEKRYRSVVQSATDAIVTIDAAGKLLTWNQGAQNIFHYCEAEILGSTLDVLRPEKLRPGDPAGMEYLLQDGEPRHMGETIHLIGRRKEGEEFPMELVVSSWNEEAEIFFTGIIRDITERQQLEDTLQYQSTHDTLTGLFNRQYYETEIERLQQGRRFPVSILMMDADGLKRTNDLHGHHAGDELLRQISQVLKSTFRPEDMIARIGGDEFVVVLPGLEASTAKRVTQRLRARLAEYNQAHSPDQYLSLSIGIACGEGGSLLSEVFKQADQAMYRDKAEKKERVG